MSIPRLMSLRKGRENRETRMVCGGREIACGPSYQEVLVGPQHPFPARSSGRR